MELKEALDKIEELKAENLTLKNFGIAAEERIERLTGLLEGGEPPTDWSKLNKRAAENYAEQFRLARNLVVYAGISPDYIHGMKIDIKRDQRHEWFTVVLEVNCEKPRNS